MSQSQVVDWRVWKAATVAKDGPRVEPGGSPVQAGDVAYVITRTTDSHLGKVDFITPSPVALALSASVRSALEAARLRSGARFREHGRAGSPKFIEIADLGTFFDYFERAMNAAVFSYQSLEAFANQVIAENVDGSLTIQQRKGPAKLDADEIQRWVSMDEKLATILPQLTGITSPKGTRLWQNYIKLKSVRDSTIHTKSRDQYVRTERDKHTLYYRLLNHSPKELPRLSIAILNHFSQPTPNVWAAAAEELLSKG